MLLLCITGAVTTTIDLVYSHLSTPTDERRCLIYSTESDSVILLVFTHISQQDLAIDADIIPLSDVSNEIFHYERRVPTSSWEDFIYPHACNPSSVYDLDLLCRSFRYNRQTTSTLTMSIYTSSSELSDDVVSRLKYISKERLDMQLYNTLHAQYPDIVPVASTISETRELTRTDDIRSRILASVESIDCDIAAVILYEYLGHRVVCSSVIDRTIYIFSDMWHMDRGHGYLNRTMMSEIIPYVRNVVRSYNPNIKMKSAIEYFQKRREDIIQRLCFISQSESFTSLLDDKINIIAMPDGLYDFSTDMFRDIRVSDYVSICTRVPYTTTQDIRLGCRMVRSILSTIFPDDDILEFFLSTVALSMGGRNFEKVLLVWIGRTDSGKSTCQEFIEYVLGGYCGSLPSNMLVGKRSNPHSATSALSNIGKRRLLFLQEPEEARINSSQLKSLCGNDSIYTREIFERAATIRVKAVTVIITNGRMDMSSCDEAALSRVLVVPFMSTFVTSREKHKYKNSRHLMTADTSIGDRLKTLGTYMLHILIGKYREYLMSGLTVPDVIRDHTNLFIQNSNPTLYYIGNCLEYKPGSKIDVTMLFSTFSIWHKDSYPGSRSISLYNFRETISASGYTIERDSLMDYIYKRMF